MKYKAILLLCLIISVTFCAQANAQTNTTTLIEALDECLHILKEHDLLKHPNEVQHAALSTIVKTADPLGRVISEADQKKLTEQHDGIISGVGIKFAISNGLPRIMEIYPDTPAAQTNLQKGDIIENIAGEETRDMYHVQVANLLRGKEGHKISLTIRKTDKIVDYDITCGPYSAQAIEVSEILPGEIPYLKLNGLYPESGLEIVGQIKIWEDQGYLGGIIDLRNADGKDVTSVKIVSECFVSNESILFAYKDKKHQDISVHKSETAKHINIPLMVLVDGNTSGAAEVLAAVFANSVQGILLLGQNTKGDMLVRDIIKLNSGNQLYLATRNLVLANGMIYNGKSGVTPEIIVSDSPYPAYEPPEIKEYITEESRQQRALWQRLKNDATLQRAVDILQGLEALNSNLKDHIDDN